MAPDWFHRRSVLQRLSDIEVELRIVREGMMNLTDIVADLQAAVQAESSEIESVVALLKQLTDLIQQNITDPAAIQQILDDVNANDTMLAQAVQQYTPPPPADAGA